MIAFSFIIPGIALATLVPAYAALYLVAGLKPLRVRYLAAAGVGLSFWYFFDTMGDAASLAENNSLYPPYLFGGLPHFALIGAFVAGVAVLAVFDHYAVPMRPAGAARGSLFLIPLAVALVMGVHGLGEGWDAVAPVSSGPLSATGGLQALTEAFGTFPALVSYPVHKFLEACIIGAVYSAYVSQTGGPVRAPWWHIPLLGLLYAGPSVVGAALGYFASFDTTYFFAFGVTASIYAALRLVEPIAPGFEVGGDAPSYFGTTTFVALAAGFLLLYTAALLH